MLLVLRCSNRGDDVEGGTGRLIHSRFKAKTAHTGANSACRANPLLVAGVDNRRLHVNAVSLHQESAHKEGQDRCYIAIGTSTTQGPDQKTGRGERSAATMLLKEADEDMRVQSGLPCPYAGVNPPTSQVAGTQ